MSEKPENTRAFPSTAIADNYGGMTLRDWFAGHALASQWVGEENPEKMAGYAYRTADAMLAERSKP